MRICIVSKFPPTEGGIASRTYWRVRRLLDEGHEVHVVTNASCVEPEYRIAGCEEHLAELCRRGLAIHDLQPESPWHIPSSPDYLDRLASVLLDVTSQGSFDVLESGYLVPYGIAAHFVAGIRGLPHIVRHGGSDLAKLLPHPEYGDLLRLVLCSAETVVTDQLHESLLTGLDVRTRTEPVYVVPEEFTSSSSRREKDTYAYVGKFNYHWRRKGLDRIVEWYRHQEGTGVRLRLVGQGHGITDFREWTGEAHGVDLPIEPFVPPWHMPDLLREFGAVFALDCDYSVHNWSMLAAEARESGVRVVDHL